MKTYGAKWTLIGDKIGRTAYVCRAAYKRHLDKSPEKATAMPRAYLPKFGGSSNFDGSSVAAAGTEYGLEQEQTILLSTAMLNVDSGGVATIESALLNRYVFHKADVVSFLRY